MIVRKRVRCLVEEDQEGLSCSGDFIAFTKLIYAMNRFDLTGPANKEAVEIGLLCISGGFRKDTLKSSGHMMHFDPTEGQTIQCGKA
jgi:predicted carbohydrate-binding protein with CBM5 and CBM33 domain